MDGLRTVQTAFRFKPEMVKSMKRQAAKSGVSLNRYVENLIERDLSSAELADFKKQFGISAGALVISEEIMGLTLNDFLLSEEDIKSDDRLSYILGK